MKPCFSKRKPIALLVLGSLEPDRATDLRRHLSACEGCGAYFRELSGVTAALTSAQEEKGDNVAPAGSFHRELVSRIKARRPRPAGINIAELWLAVLRNWRTALPTAAGIAVALGILLALPKGPETPMGLSNPQQTASLKVNRELAPTFANYQAVANRSLDKLDELLSEQGSRNLPPAPVYSGSSW